MEANKVRAIIEEWTAGVRSRDIEAVLRHHARELLMFDVVGPVRLQGWTLTAKRGSSSSFPGTAGQAASNWST
jgi:ketosteroid isomerase-like protein